MGLMHHLVCKHKSDFNYQIFQHDPNLTRPTTTRYPHWTNGRFLAHRMKFGKAIENCNFRMGRKESIIAKTTSDKLRSGGGAVLLVRNQSGRTVRRAECY